MVEEEKQLETTQETMSDTSDVLQPNEGETASNGTNGAGEVVPDFVVSDADVDLTGEGQAAEAESSSVAATNELLQQIETLKAQLEDRTSQFMRIAADFDNFRKRTQKEKEDLEQQVKCSTVVELLPVVDNFERARSQIKPQGDEGMAIHKSYQGVYKDLVDRLKRIGVAPMRSEGKEFDPILHEAVMRESTDEYPEGTVIEELQRGYLLGERVLRHAMVKVAAAPEPSAEGDQDNGSSEG